MSEKIERVLNLKSKGKPFIESYWLSKIGSTPICVDCAMNEIKMGVLSE